MSEDEYIRQLEYALLDVASMFGGGASPSLQKWVKTHAELIVSVRQKRGRSPGVVQRLIGEKNHDPQA